MGQLFHPNYCLFCDFFYCCYSCPNPIILRLMFWFWTWLRKHLATSVRIFCWPLVSFLPKLCTFNVFDIFRPLQLLSDRMIVIMMTLSHNIVHHSFLLCHNLLLLKHSVNSENMSHWTFLQWDNYLTISIIITSIQKGNNDWKITRDFFFDIIRFF